MDFSFLSQADHLTLQLELARANLENAKVQFESAKAAHEEHLAQAEERGIPKAKLKKLAEDRVQALLECGLVTRAAGPLELGPKKERPSRKPKVLDLAEGLPEAASVAAPSLAAQ